MKLLIRGASGGTGLEIVRQAIKRGHAVTVLVRSPEKLQAFSGSITVEKGSPLSDSELISLSPLDSKAGQKGVSRCELGRQLEITKQENR